MVWHAVEEIEHKSVAFDVLRVSAVPYAPRVRALGAAVQQMLLELDPVTTYMLEVDGVRGARSRLRRYAFRAQFVAAVAPRLAMYAIPGYDPSGEPDPPFVRAWVDAYDAGKTMGTFDPSFV
jgi:predicted metal-dependent hydrolase